MNKLFAKIASITAGLALVAGAGVALASHADAKGVKAADETIDLTAQGFSDQQDITTVTSGSITLTFAKASGSNPPKYYTNGTSVRTYANNTLTVATSGSDPITKVVFTLGKTTSATPTANTGSYDSGSKTWTGSASSIIFTNASTGQYHYQQVAVTTTPGGGGGEEDPVLQSISVSNEKTSYTVGDEFVKPTVTAHFDKGDDQDVSASASCTGYNMGVAGEYTVTVSYGGKTTTYDITVSAAEPTGDVLYSATFTEVATHGYTQNKEFTLNEKDWVASVSQVNGGVFYLGCNSTHAAKGILNDNSSFSDVVAALAAEDDPYGADTSKAHAYAMRFANAYENVGSVTFTWAGGNNAFQVYIFGDRGSGLEKLAHEDYATSGTAVSGSVSWSAEEYGENFDSFVIVARPGATGSTATSKTLRPATFQIVAGEEPIDPGLDNMVINGLDTDLDEVPYGDSHDFAAFDNEIQLSDVSWTVSDETVLSLYDNGDGSVGVTGLKEGSAKLIANAEGYSKAEKLITVNIGEYNSLSVSGSMSKTDYKSNEEWSKAGFTVTAHTTFDYEKDVTSDVSWTYSPESPAEGVTSVVATAHYLELSAASSAQTVSVEVVETHAGTLEDPYTVANAREAIDSGTGMANVYATGIVSEIVTAYNSTYKNVSFNISEDGTTTSDQLQAYRCKGSDSYTVDSADSVKVGAIVVVYGTLKKYNSTYEFDANCQVISHEMPITDVDISFDPSVKSYEIGDTGTFVATSETSGAVITYSVDEPTILSVNETTGAFEALSLGVARVTATATAGGKEGSLHVDITVNGATTLSVSEANEIAAGVESGKTTSYYVYVEGYVAEFGTSMSGTSPRALDIMDESGNKIMVYTNTGPYPSFIDGLSLGDYLKVKANVQNYKGTYELTNPEKLSSSYSAWSLAFEILSETDSVCNEYDGVTDNADAIAAKWETLGGEGHYASLNSAEKAKLIEGIAKEDGTTLEQALARYDYLTAKYNLDGFISDRAPSAGRYTPANLTVAEDSNVAIAVVAIVAVASISAIAVILIIKRRKAFDR